MCDVFFNSVGYFRIRVCSESDTTTTAKTFSQKKKASSNSSPGFRTLYFVFSLVISSSGFLAK